MRIGNLSGLSATFVLSLTGAVAGAQTLEDAEALIDTRQFHAATAVLTPLIVGGTLETSDLARAHLLRGMASMYRRRMRDAYADYSQSHALDPTSPDVQLWLGVAEKYGHSGTRDPGKARPLLEGASAAGLGQADYELAHLLLSANAADEAGIAALLRAAERRDPSAMILLARGYEAGQMVERDTERALFWYEQAAAAGNADAAYKLGYVYRAGQGVPIDLEKAAVFQKLALDGASWEAELVAGNDFETAKDWEQANYYYWRSAESDHDPGRLNTGVGFMTGDRGMRQDFRTAFYWLNQARGLVFGAQYTALMLDGGLGVAENSEEAFALVEPIISRSVTAKALAAMMLQSGRGTAADTARAATLFAELEQSETASDLGTAAWLLSTHQDPAARQPELALRLAQRSYDLEPDFGAMDTLASAHAAMGDFDEAVQWMERALATGGYQTEGALVMANRRLASFRAGQPRTDGPIFRYEYDTPVESSERVRAVFIGEIVGMFTRSPENNPRGFDTEIGESNWGLNILVQSVESGSLPYFMREYGVFYIHSPSQFFGNLPEDVIAFTAPVGPHRFVLSEIQTNGWRYDLTIEPVTGP